MSVGAAAPPTRVRPTRHDAPAGGRLAALCLIALGVVALFVAGIAAVFYFTTGMVNTADDFFKAVKEKDIAKARRLLANQ